MRELRSRAEKEFKVNGTLRMELEPQEWKRLEEGLKTKGKGPREGNEYLEGNGTLRKESRPQE